MCLKAMKMKKFFKKIIYLIVDILYIPTKNKAVILMYHSIGYNKKYFTVTPDNFDLQMSILKNNFNVISLVELNHRLKNKIPFPNKTVVITFDDGYVDNLSIAYPILKKYNLPATIFLATGFLGKKMVNTEDIDNLFIMSEEQILNLQKNDTLIDFQPHSVSHRKMDKLDMVESGLEMKKSKECVEKILGKKCSFFAFPFGKYNENILNIAKKEFLLSLSTKKGVVTFGGSNYVLPRNSVDSEVGMRMFNVICKFGRL